MIKVIIIDKGGTLKESKVNNPSELYKNCGFRKINNFEKHHTWVITLKECNTIYKISIYGKVDGRAGSENKYDLPPPEDNTLYFGKLALVNEDGDLTIDVWEKIYNQLFGGFEDLNSEEELSDDELEEYPEEMKTSSGYLKDGFVVSDEELEEENYIYSDEDK